MHTLNSNMDHSIKDSPRDWDLTNIMFQHGKQNDWLYDVLQELQGLRNERKDLQNELERANKAAKIAEDAGVKVVMNRCPKIEYARLFGELGWNGFNIGVISVKRRRI